jgi:hypothetical protein
MGLTGRGRILEKINENGKKEYIGKKERVPLILSLAMLKMEKNFIAVEKGYPRQPYAPESGQPLGFLIGRMEQELEELKEAFKRKDWTNMREEVADLSNLCDFSYEELAAIEKQEAYRRGMDYVFNVKKEK